jgi:hypothetical protein
VAAAVSPGWRAEAMASWAKAADATCSAERPPLPAPGLGTAPALTASASARFTPATPASTLRVRLVFSNNV